MKLLIIILSVVFSFNSLADISEVIDTPECEELKTDYLQAQSIVMDIHDELSIGKDRWRTAYHAEVEATEKAYSAKLEAWEAREKLRPIVQRHNELLKLREQNPSEEVIQTITQMETLREALQTAVNNAESAHVLAKANETLATNDFEMVEESIHSLSSFRFDWPPQQQKLMDELKLAEESADQQFFDFFVCYEEVHQLPKKDCRRKESRMTRARNKYDKAYANYEKLNDKFDDLNYNGPDNMLEAASLPATGASLAMRLHFAERNLDRSGESFRERERLYMECISETQQGLRTLLDEFLENELKEIDEEVSVNAS